MEERRIDFKDLLSEILLHWRMMIAWLVIGAVLSAGYSAYSYRRDQKNYEELMAAYEQQEAEKAALLAEKESEKAALLAEVDAANQALLSETTTTNAALQAEADALNEKFAAETDPQIIESQLKAQLTPVQIANIETVLATRTWLEEREQYMAENVLMQMDPMNIPQAEIVYEIQDDEGQLGQIRNLYSMRLLTNEMFETLEKDTGCPAGDLKSVLTVSNKTALDYVLTIRYYDQEKCEKIAAATMDYMTKIRTDIVRQGYAHKLKQSSYAVVSVQDKGLMDTQRGVENEINAYRSSLANSEANFLVPEKNYYNYVLTGKKPDVLITPELMPLPEETEQDVLPEEEEKEELEDEILLEDIVLPKLNVRMGGVGALAFWGIYIFWLFLRYVFSDKLRFCEDWQQVVGIKKLGIVSILEFEDNRGGAIDKYFYYLKDRKQAQCSWQEQVRIIGDKIACYLGEEKNLCVVDAEAAEGGQCVYDLLQQCLKEKKINIQFCDNLYASKNVEEIRKADNVLLVKWINMSAYPELKEEVEFIRYLNTEIIGGVAIEHKKRLKTIGEYIKYAFDRTKSRK